MVPCTWVAPARTPDRALATPQPVSLCRCTPTGAPRASTISATMAYTSCGSEPPLVSHSTSRSAPASATAASTASE